jgi:hypothetical protein
MVAFVANGGITFENVLNYQLLYVIEMQLQ